MSHCRSAAPDESARLKPLQSRRRKSSHFNKWIEEQQKHPTEKPVLAPNLGSDSHPTSITGTKCNPYLAYPHLSRLSLSPSLCEPMGMTTSNANVDEDNLNISVMSHRNKSDAFNDHNRRPSKLLKPPSVRNFQSTLRSPSPSATSSVSRQTSRLSIFHRHFTSSPTASTMAEKKHNRSCSASTIDISSRERSPQSNSTNPALKSWKWRPTVLGHFSNVSSPLPNSPSSVDQHTPSRPSISSSSTYTSPAYDGGFPCTPPNFSTRESGESHIRASGRTPLLTGSPGSESSPSLCYTATSQANGSRTLSESSSELGYKSKTIRIPFSPKRIAHPYLHSSQPKLNDCDDYSTLDPFEYDNSRPHVAYSANGSHGTLPRIMGSTRNKNKRRLVVSGVGINEVGKFEGVKRWCETFGEVSQIVRMPNGDLHVDFRSAEVAETVCRLRAKVRISGVGSVYLSWLTGAKR